MSTKQLKKYKPSFYNILQEDKETLYLINTFTKAVISFELYEQKMITSLLKEKEIIMDDANEYHSALIENGFLVEQMINEQELLEYKYNQYHFGSDYLFITFIPTMKCNFSCPYCFEDEKALSLDDEKVEILKRYMDVNFKHKQFITLSLFGGEPLLEWRRVSELLEYGIRLQDKYNFIFNIGLTTNAYLLNQKIIDDLVDTYHCKSYQVTIDANRKTHNSTRCLKNGDGTYDVVLKNFKLLIQKNKECGGDIHISLRINLINNTLEEVNELLNEFSDDEKNYFHTYFRPVYNTRGFRIENKNEDNLESFYLALRKKSGKRVVSFEKGFSFCEGDSGLNTINIMPDLSIWKCMNDIHYEEAKIGFIKPDGQCDNNLDKLQKWSEKNPFNRPICKSCIYLPFCYGGCPLKYQKEGRTSCSYEKNFNLLYGLLQ